MATRGDISGLERSTRDDTDGLERSVVERFHRVDRQIVVVEWMVGLVWAVQIIPILRSFGL